MLLYTNIVLPLAHGDLLQSTIFSTWVCDAQVNEFVKRVRAARIHMLIVGHLRKQMPALMGKRAAQERLLRNLSEEFAHVQREHHLPPGVCMPQQAHPKLLRKFLDCHRMIHYEAATVVGVPPSHQATPF
jgi:hypothetical protein